MKKRKGWQLALILSVVLLAVYNILPTIFFYSQPLNEQIGEKGANEISVSMMKRVNNLEHDSLEWLESFNQLIGIKPLKVQPVKKNPQLIELQFSSLDDVTQFKNSLPAAGQLIPFYPSQLTLGQEDPTALYEAEEATNAHVVYVQRKIPMLFDTSEPNRYFSHSKMYHPNGEPTREYLSIIEDRLFQFALCIGGPSDDAGYVMSSLEGVGSPRSDEFLYMISHAALNIDRVFTGHPQLAKRFYARILQGPIRNKTETTQSLISAFTSLKDRLQLERISLDAKNIEEDKTTSAVLSSQIIALKEKEERLLKTITLFKANKDTFIKAPSPWESEEIENKLTETFKTTSSENQYNFYFDDQDPLVDSIDVDMQKQTFAIKLKSDILALKKTFESDPSLKERADGLDQIIYSKVAKIVRWTDEKLTPIGSEFVVKLKDLPNSSSFIALRLAKIAKAQYDHTKHLLYETWSPSSIDLKRDSYPIVGWKDYEKKPAHKKNFQLILYAPSIDSKNPALGFKANSIYIIAKDLGRISRKFQNDPFSKEAKLAQEDFDSLAKILKSNGFTGYPGTTYPLSSTYADDYIFEASDFFLPLLKATRENFSVHGTKKWAVLELSDLKQRILTLNQIETEEHQDLLSWKEEYLSAQADPTERKKYEVPKPTTNVLLNNLKLSTKKYFRGDERKILHWGLDLKGGKNVQVALKDTNGKTVTDEADIKQGIDELFNRVNKMGVSDVSIRQEGSNISLDFPGAENISAADLVKASSMTFHIINEKFTPQNSNIGRDVDQFLTEIWNEAVVTGKKDIEDINRIAWAHLYGDSMDSDAIAPRSEAAKILFESDLRLMNPQNPDISNEFNDKVSKISMYRGDNYSDWHGQAHPLMVTFKNVVLEGSNLENVHASYDPSRGNYIVFEIKGSQTLSNGIRIHPRNTLYTWTSIFAKDRVTGTPYEMHSRGSGWRMAVILNGYVVSAPVLEEPIKHSGSISGQFTQAEINRLVSDLKAGSLSFTPQILSETSVSPELGMKERVQSIGATIVALLGVIAIMIGYYRFGGVIASIAVIFNLIIIWATLQNIGATITIAMLAGVILTLGMAVDANVLVFERIREEFAKTGKLQIAINAGYQKAYSAIIDSNITTIIAAVILLNFDSGPIKGFAVSLIIGIISSMFTALFMTRYFFSAWVQRSKAKKLTMANWIKPRNWNFLKYGKLAMTVSLVVIAIGSALLIKDRSTIFGMDFTGGYAVNIEMKQDDKIDYKQSVEDALVKAGASTQDFSIRQLGFANSMRIFFSTSMNEGSRPFANMSLKANAISAGELAYKSNPRLVWLVDALEDSGLVIQNKSLVTLDQNFKSISGQMSTSMRNNAIYGLLLALFAILIYITIRFEFKYAISATIGLAFDVMITLGLIGILHFIRVPVQIDLNTIAALMTIVGYSLNDTIIVFDRIREDVKTKKKQPLREIVNTALNLTLSRTLMTSLTTLLVLLALVFFGGSSIFGFSLVMAIGVVVGTLSTFFLATILLLFFQKFSHDKKDDKVILNGA